MKFFEPIFSEIDALAGFLVIWPAAAVGAAVVAAGAAVLSDGLLLSLPQAATATDTATRAMAGRWGVLLMVRSGSSSW